MKFKEASCLLMIVDGWGLAPAGPANAVKSAHTPVLDRLMDTFPNTTLKASGLDVGLPEGVMGNSEVGHLNLGAGRIVYQDLLRIDRSIEDGSFFKNPLLLEAMAKLKASGGSCHLMGLLSDGGVHSSINHLKALIQLAAENKLPSIALHPILDGRDTAPDSGLAYLEDILSFTGDIPEAFLATLCGRFYAMDRDTRWERTKKAFDLYISGDADFAEDPLRALNASYDKGLSDEFFKPIKFFKDDKGLIKDGDLLIFFNFRADRARQLIMAFNEDDFTYFQRSKKPSFSCLCMTSYDANFNLPVLFPSQSLDNILASIIDRAGFSQLRIAETEKYAHVTYFFNGGEERAFNLEERILIPSPREFETYDLCPEMSADLICETFLGKLATKSYNFMVLNFANMDMVGHTGNFKAALKACEVVDKNIGFIADFFIKNNIPLIITSDHGNAEQMLDRSGKVHTAHTCNSVPFILVSDKYKNIRLRSGRLADVAPSILDILGLDIPSDMDGESLILK